MLNKALYQLFDYVFFVSGHLRRKFHNRVVCERWASSKRIPSVKPKLRIVEGV